MITKAQLQELKTANAMSETAVGALIKQWEAELFTKDMQKNDAVEITVQNHNKTETRTVAGVRISKSFALCPSAWGDKKWNLMHIKTGLACFTGKKNAVSKGIKEIIAQPFWEEFDTAMETYEAGSPLPLDQDNTAIVRDIHNRVSSGKI